MKEEEWKDLLQTYQTPDEVISEVLVGVADHLDTKCTTGNTRTVPTTGPQPRFPFREEPLVCDRGSGGCNLVHNDLQALRFARMGLERYAEMQGLRV